jgi:hypothetical protein
VPTQSGKRAFKKEVAGFKFRVLSRFATAILTKVRPTSDFRDLSSHTPAKGATDGKQQLAAVAHPARKTMKATVRCECDATRCRAPSVSFGQPRKLKVSGFLKPCRLRLAGIIECRA